MTPPFNQIVILLAFTVALTAFHTVLVYARPLSALAWKKVDYIWFSLAVIGILGSVQANRAAQSEVEAQSLRTEAAALYAHIFEAARWDNFNGTCLRIAKPSTSSGPLFEKWLACTSRKKWVERVTSRIIEQGTQHNQPIDIEKIMGATSIPAKPIEQDLFTPAIMEYNKAIFAITNMTEAAKPNWFEELSKKYGPLFLAVALALRITKITGEIRLTREK